MAREDLINDYADLGVSCGYVGGVHTWGDDRSFRVFTRVRPMHHGLHDRVCIRIFDVPYGFKGTWKEPVQFDTPEVRAELDALRAAVANGTHLVNPL